MKTRRTLIVRRSALRRLIPCFCASVALWPRLAAAPAAQQGTYFPPAGRVGEEGARGAGPRSGQAAGGDRLRASRARVEPRDGLLRSGAHLRHAARLGAEHSRQDQRRRHLQGLRRRRVRRHDVGRSDLLGREEHAGDGRRHRRARRARSPTSTRRSARRSRTAATIRRATRRSPGSTTCSRPASGKATCSASRTTSSARKPSAKAR